MAQVMSLIRLVLRRNKMQMLHLCRRHVTQATIEAQEKYGPNFSREVMINVVGFEDACWYCKNNIPFDD